MARRMQTSYLLVNRLLDPADDGVTFATLRRTTAGLDGEAAWNDRVTSHKVPPSSQRQGEAAGCYISVAR
jgi:hypothetical protein